jgi:hypothetical protein
MQTTKSLELLPYHLQEYIAVEEESVFEDFVVVSNVWLRMEEEEEEEQEKEKVPF